MPRKKSQPAKYYHCSNEVQNDEIISGENYGVCPLESVQTATITNIPFEARACSSPKSDEFPNHSVDESCKSEESADSQKCEMKSSPNLPFVLSLKKESEDNKDNGDEAASDMSLESNSRNGFIKSCKPKEENDIDLTDKNTSNNDDHQNITKPKVESTAPRTLQDYVYRVIDIYYSRHYSLGNSYSLNNELRSRKHNVDNRQNVKVEACDYHDNSVNQDQNVDSTTTKANGLRLSMSDDTDECLFSQSPTPSNGGSGCENELIVKKNGSISSDLDQCGTCFKVLKRSSMREHMDRHNDTGRYRCEVCNKTFSKLSSKEKHVLIHTDQRPFKCDKCNKAYRQKIHLVEHMRSHTGERPFACPHCSYTLASKSLLNRHLKTHDFNKIFEDDDSTPGSTDVLRLTPKKEQATDSSPTSDAEAIACGACHHQFKTEKQLICHIDRIHKSDNHKCEQCSRIFTTARGLTNHLYNTHKHEQPAQPHPCPDCEKSFAHSSSLMKHRVKEHGHRSSSLVQVLPGSRKTVHDDNQSLHSSNDNGSVKMELHDEDSPKPSKMPRLTVVNGSEDIQRKTPIINQFDIPELMTSKCEIKGSDM